MRYGQHGGGRDRAQWWGPNARRRLRRSRSCCEHHLGPEARMITFPLGVRVWLATGHTDMRRGFPSLALMVQEQLKQDPYSGHLFIFRERRGALIKVIWICYSN